LFNGIAIHDEEIFFTMTHGEQFSNPFFSDSSIQFNKRPLRIIGVVSDKQMGGASSSLNLYAPYTTVMNRISGSKKIGSITVFMMKKSFLP